MKNKYALSLIFLAISTFVLVAFFIFKPKTVDKEQTNVLSANKNKLVDVKKEPEYLFVHSAEEGTFENIEGDKYILTVSNPQKDVIYFSDRPFRETGKEKLGMFLNLLGFEVGSAPNATIVSENKEGKKTMIVTELTEPIWNKDENSLTYIATVLRDETEKSAEYGNSSIPQNFQKVTFFIDSGTIGLRRDGKKNNWKKDKDKKCHGMTLKEAYKIASGNESECLLYDNAKLSTTTYTCDDKMKAWKIDMNTNLKGEASKCDAYCIILTSEEYKKGEGVARIEYACDKKSEEKEPKNKYCPKPDLSKGHDNDKAKENLTKEYHHILEKASDHKTSYEHHYCVKTGMPYTTKKHWATDCSGLGGFALFETLPYHYKLIDENRSAHTKADRPLASDFYEYIKNLKDDNKCWKRIDELKYAKQGDFLVVKYDKRAGENSTGHVMWIDKAPQWHDVAGHYEIEVIDSANSGHGDDTRKNNNTYNCEGSKNCGIGKGEITIYAKDGKDGEPVRYKWNTKLSSDQYVPYKKDCPDKENCRLEGIVIGRVKDCKVKK